MRSNISRGFLLVSMALALADSHAQLNIVPEPNSITPVQGTFSLSASTEIACPVTVKTIGNYLAQQISVFAHVKPSVVSQASSGKNVVSMMLDKTLETAHPGGYTLDVMPDNVVLNAATEQGLFMGVQTLLQLIPVVDSVQRGQYEMPCCRIVDFPRFGWRGLNLDCVRHFMTKDFVKRYIDLLAYYKFNVFHWHLTDDQGWRIEIKKYPRLTQVGAWRKEADGSIYGGFYTREEIREIVEYAKSRFIAVVPEIEMPGHCQASLASYPENACIDGPFEVGIQWGVYRNIYCPGKESTFNFLENVLGEVMDLFPSHYIHIGGDEVPKDEWYQNDSCLQLMKEKGLKSGEELQSYFIRRIQKFLESHGREIIGWDEILEGMGPDSGAVVQSWRGVDGALQAARRGNETIVSPGGYTYLSGGAEGLSIDTVYSFDPIPAGLTVDEQKHVLGTEASMWTERAPQETIDSKIFPRLLAIAEVAWTLPGNKNLKDFHRRLDRQYRRLATLGVDYGLEKRAIVYQTKFDKARRRYIVDLKSTQTGTQPVYTVGDTLTMENARPYAKPVTIEGTSTIIAQAKMKGRLVGNPITLSFIVDEALGSKVTVQEPYTPRYAASGLRSLVDGIRGTWFFRDGLWQGYEGTDIHASVDLGRPKTLTQLGAGFYQESGSWIFLPDSVEYFVSTDGKHFEEVGVSRNDVSQQDPAPVKKDFVVRFEKRKARYLKLIAHNIGVCPPWHSGAGGKAWLFIDEIFAN
jgi:hexosaminidase